MLVMTAAAANSQSNCKRLAAAASAPNSLLIVESHRRHVREHHSLETTNVDADFHRGRDT